jgi:hypothetical protein
MITSVPNIRQIRGELRAACFTSRFPGIRAQDKTRLLLLRSNLLAPVTCSVECLASDYGGGDHESRLSQY